MLTGCRPQDACSLRGADLDRTGDVRGYRPPQHKTAHLGTDRAVYLGPKAQALIAPWLGTAGDGYVFSPARWVAEMHAARTANRTTSLYPSHERRNREKRVTAPERKPGERYRVSSYGHAIARACGKAGVPHWHPNQLRHAFATEVRKRHGLEAAQVLLGHAKADLTQVYAERDEALAVTLAAEMS